jgi:hypothetical protein
MCIMKVAVKVAQKLWFCKLNQIMHVVHKGIGPRGLCDKSDK